MSLRHLSDSSVLSAFATLVWQNQQITAALISHILEIEHRQLYRDLGYGSIRSFLIGEHHLPEDAAEKRVQAAHAVRRFPRILDRIADGRLHLSAVLVLSGSIDESNAEELLDAATHKTRSQIEALLRARRVNASSGVTLPEMDLTSGSEPGEPAPGRDDELSLTRTLQLPAPGRVQSAPAQIENGRLSQVTLRESTREKLRRAHDLLAGAVPFGDHDRVIDQALDALMSRLEKRKFGATSKPRARTKPSENPRTIPAEVRRAVFARDGGRCTFVGPTGHRCESRVVELDHIVPIAKVAPRRSPTCGSSAAPTTSSRRNVPSVETSWRAGGDHRHPRMGLKPTSSRASGTSGIALWKRGKRRPSRSDRRRLPSSSRCARRSPGSGRRVARQRRP